MHDEVLQAKREITTQKEQNDLAMDAIKQHKEKVKELLKEKTARDHSLQESREWVTELTTQIGMLLHTANTQKQTISEL